MKKLRHSFIITSLALMACSILQAQEFRPLLTGEVFSRQAQDVIVPLTKDWKAGINLLIEEGVEVKPGDIVAEFDGSEAYGQLEQQREKTRAEAAVTERDLAKLELENTQARFAVQQAHKTLELATLKADIPKGLIGAIEHSENQLAQEKAIKGIADAELWLVDKRKSLADRQQRAQLEQRKGELIEVYVDDLYFVLHCLP